MNNTNKPSANDSTGDADGSSEAARGVPGGASSAVPTANERSPAAGTVSADSGPAEQPSGDSSGWLFRLQLAASLGLTLAVAAYLIFSPAGDGHSSESLESGVASLPRAVRQVDAAVLWVDPTSRLGAQLRVGRVGRAEIETPLVRVTGTVAASLRPVEPDLAEQWQFNEPEALEAYFNHRLATVDAQFAEEQIQRVEQLNTTRLRSQQQILDRLRRLVEAGTDTLADLQVAEAEYLQAEIEGRQAIHEATSDYRRARQALAVSSRQLQLVGLDVEMLQQASADVDIVVAEVPEDYLSLVRLGQQCQAVFLGFPREVFPGVVQRISPTLSLERRALRVLFFVDDPDDKLRPGMFADIGLGTEPRMANLVPSTAVIHIGRDDYVWMRDAEVAEHWRLAQVQIGDGRRGMVEVLSGLDDATEVIIEGAILLKPIAASMVRQATRGDR